MKSTSILNPLIVTLPDKKILDIYKDNRDAPDNEMKIFLSNLYFGGKIDLISEILETEGCPVVKIISMVPGLSKESKIRKYLQTSDGKSVIPISDLPKHNAYKMKNDIPCIQISDLPSDVKITDIAKSYQLDEFQYFSSFKPGTVAIDIKVKENSIPETIINFIKNNKSFNGSPITVKYGYRSDDGYFETASIKIGAFVTGLPNIFFDFNELKRKLTINSPRFHSRVFKYNSENVMVIYHDTELPNELFKLIDTTEFLGNKLHAAKIKTDSHFFIYPNVDDSASTFSCIPSMFTFTAKQPITEVRESTELFGEVIRIIQVRPDNFAVQFSRSKTRNKYIKALKKNGFNPKDVQMDRNNLPNDPRLKLLYQIYLFIESQDKQPDEIALDLSRLEEKNLEDLIKDTTTLLAFF